MDGDVAECLQGCDGAGIFEGCESETVAFIDCYEANDCVGTVACTNQAIAWSMCFNVGL
jgi:hypothetical protein